MAVDRIPMPSPNYSSRGGAGCRLIVLHTAEGALTIESLGNFFASSSAGVSSHAGADDKPNAIGVYVERANKAWTQANANPYAVSLELCAFAAWSSADWDAHPEMLNNAGKWVGEEAAAFGIPLVELSAFDAQNGAAGVCDHVDLGGWGGGHWDCGDAFPMARVLDIARGNAPETEPEPEPEEDEMGLTICAAHGDGTQWLTDMATFKRHIMGTDDWNTTVWCLVASGTRLYYQDVNNPIRVPRETIDAIPEVKT